jgi:uncharacterized damage-inducible protein DinB
MTESEFFIKRWTGEYPAFVRVMKALPKDKLDYRPHPRSRSAGELAWLLALEERSGSELVERGQIDWQEPTPEPPADLAKIIAAFEHAHAELQRRLATVSDAAWERKVTFLVNGQLVMEETMGEFMWMSLLDAIHHRGQLSVYIRPMGGKVPSIYGPSADDMGQ